MIEGQTIGCFESPPTSRVREKGQKFPKFLGWEHAYEDKYAVKTRQKRPERTTCHDANAVYRYTNTSKDPSIFSELPSLATRTYTRTSWNCKMYKLDSDEWIQKDKDNTQVCVDDIIQNRCAQRS